MVNVFAIVLELIKHGLVYDSTKNGIIYNGKTYLGRSPLNHIIKQNEKIEYIR